ncbi:MAG: DUF3817 domain-containing protein [Ferruginibacter sp.]
MKSPKLFSWFRKIALLEGLSFILLLGIAMPLKYMADMPLAVRIIGSIHGALFVAYMILAWEVNSSHRMKSPWMIKAFFASILPFGTFILDREWKKEEAAIVSGK